MATSLFLAAGCAEASTRSNGLFPPTTGTIEHPVQAGGGDPPGGTDIVLSRVDVTEGAETSDETASGVPAFPADESADQPNGGDADEEGGEQPTTSSAADTDTSVPPATTTTAAPATTTTTAAVPVATTTTAPTAPTTTTRPVTTTTTAPTASTTTTRPVTTTTAAPTTTTTTTTPVPVESRPAGPAQQHRLAAAMFVTCALRFDDTVACWGAAPPQFRAPDETGPPAGKFKTVSGQFTHWCGIGADDTAVCWGSVRRVVPTFDGSFKAISAGAYTCGIRADNTVICKGWDGDGRAASPEGRFKALSVASSFACAIRLDDTAHCWGWGASATGKRWRYKGLEPPDEKFKSISTGGFAADGGQGFLHVCGLRFDDTLRCWGNHRAIWELEKHEDWDPDKGNYGLLDPPDGKYKAVSVGGRHACAIRSDDTLRCWGNNNERARAVPSGLGRVIAVSAGVWHTCVFVRGGELDGAPRCWGGGNGKSYGQTVPPLDVGPSIDPDDPESGDPPGGRGNG